MRLIGLPGRNPETEAWMTRLLEKLHVGQTDRWVAHYLHWEREREGEREGERELDVDVQAEAARLEISASDFVVAKSLGTMIALANAQASQYPARAVFIGTPLRGYADSQRAALQDLSSRTRALYIQQSADFTGSYEELRDLLPASATSVEVAGDDHVYADVDDLAAIINAWATGD